MGKFLVGIIVASILLAGAYYLMYYETWRSFVSDRSQPVSPPPSPVSGANNDSMMEKNDTMGEGMMDDHMSGTAVIVFDGNGYSPATITVKAGTKVTFENNSDTQTWPASAMHPTHAVYPGSGITKCGVEGIAPIFDACRELRKGESFSFPFNEKGEWRYHDHLNPTHFGKVIVE